MLRKGVIAGNPITYISRLYDIFGLAYLSGLTELHRWNTNNVPRWNGFFSEVIAVPPTFHSAEINVVNVRHSYLCSLPLGTSGHSKGRSYLT